MHPMLYQTLQKQGGGSQLLVERKLMTGKKKITMDFKKDLDRLRELVLKSDVLLDPYRPGVLEAIGLDPVKLLEVGKSHRFVERWQMGRN